MDARLALPAAAGVSWTLPALAPIVPSVARALRIPLRLDAAAGVALTFDDGPHPDGTPATLEELARAGAQATFFLVGEQVQRRPALAAELVAAGHTVALHGHRHRNLLRLGPRALAEDLRRGHATIADATGIAPELYRPPYGIFSPAALAYARRRGWRALLWSHWGRDWAARATAASIARRATRDLHPGDVVLLHDADFYSVPGSWRRTVAALPAILEALEARDLSAVTP
jgi:peptidoglycan/xylan/chitin deacetylase (PgdA/CDA1 family)